MAYQPKWVLLISFQHPAPQVFTVNGFSNETSGWRRAKGLLQKGASFSVLLQLPPVNWSFSSSESLRQAVALEPTHERDLIIFLYEGDDFHQADTHIFIMGNGSPHQAPQLKRSRRTTVPVLSQLLAVSPQLCLRSGAFSHLKAHPVYTHHEAQARVELLR